MIEIANDSEGQSAAVAAGIENAASSSGQRQDRPRENDAVAAHRQLLCPQRLYGRRKEMQCLTQALARVSNGHGSEVVFVTGPTGSGKTVLVEHLRSSIVKSGGVFGVAAFDKFTRNHPHSAILDAFNEVCNILVQTGDFDNFDARRTIKEQLGGEAKFVKTIIPQLASVLDDDVNRRAASNTGIQTFDRFKGACCRFLNALVASQNRHIVLLFDGLDSADQGSLQVMQSLITNPFSKRLLIIGTCRNSDICNLVNSGTEEQQQPPWPIITLNLAFLDMEAFIEFVSAALHKPSQDVTSLCEFLHLKTQGNPFHVMQFLHLFQSQGTMTYSLEQGWIWDMTSIHDTGNKVVSAVALLQDQIDHLDVSTRSVLQIAALMGNCFDPAFVRDVVIMEQNTLPSKYVIPPDTCDIDRVLDVATRNYMVEKTYRGGRYRFTHDSIAETFYQMVTDEERAQFHHAIGNRARQKRQNSTNTDAMLFTSTDHLNYAGSILIHDATAMRKLNIEAATCAMSKRAFISAITYLESGLDWMGGRNWNSKYEETLFMMHKLAQAYSCLGKVDLCQEVVDSIVEHARCIQDKMPAYFSLIDCLANHNQSQEVIDLCLTVLNEVGEKVPRKITKTQTTLEMMKAKSCLKGASASAIMLIPEMRDETKIVVTRLLAIAALHAYYLERHEVLSLFASRSVQIIMKYGRSEMVAPAFALYGLSNACAGNHKDAFHFGGLAMRLMDMALSKESLAYVTTISCTRCLHWETNLGQLVEPMSRAYSISDGNGDTKSAIQSGVALLDISLASGRHLFELGEEAQAICRDNTVYNKDQSTLGICSCFWQGALNLLARCDHPLVLNGDAMNQDTMMTKFSQTNDLVGLRMLWYVRLQLSCYFRSWDVALEMAENLGTEESFPVGSFNVPVVKFFQALAYIEGSRNSGTGRKHKGALNKNIRDLKKIAHNGEVWCKPLVLLLEAEVASLQSNKKGLKKAYDDAVASAGVVDLLNIRALANECAGIVFLNNDDYLSDQYLSEALECYYQWGAIGKVEQLEIDHRTLQSRPKVVTSVSSSRGSGTNSTGRKKQRGGQNNRVVLFE